MLAPNEACEPRSKDHRPLDRSCVGESQPHSISSTQPSEYRRVHLYGVPRVCGLFNIVKLTTALYDKRFANQFEYSLPPGFDRCVLDKVVARYSSDLRQFIERHLAAESALHKPQSVSNVSHIGSQRSGERRTKVHRHSLDRYCSWRVEEGRVGSRDCRTP